MTRAERGHYGAVRARGVIKDLQIEAPDEIDPEEIAAHYGVFVVDAGLRGADGRLVFENGQAIIRVRGDITEPRRRRSVIAHEFGHFFLHSKQSSLAICATEDMLRYDDHDGETEAEANWFAAELLMPARLFRPSCDVSDVSFARIELLARHFRTTMTATAIRFVDLAPEACALVWSERGRVRWCITGPDFRGFIPRGRSVTPDTLAHHVAKNERNPAEPEVVDATAWLGDGHGELVEDARYFRTFGATLSLLWQPSSESEHDGD